MNFAVTDPQLLLKATPPRVSKLFLTRSRLSSTAPGLSDKSVVVIQAPAGFGKTSLLSQWRREALRNGTVSAWLSVDERDNGARFAQGLDAAMGVACGRAGFGESYLRTPGSAEDDLDALTNWLAEVAHMAVEIELVLDDVHMLPKSTLETSLPYLVRNAPANLRVFLGSRKQLPVTVSDLLKSGQFAVLNCNSLKLTLDETISVITSRFGSRADSDLCARMYDLTEGWALGLQLVIATIENRSSLSDAINGFSVRTGDIQRYFVECLVSRLPSDLAEFLIRVSFVDELHSDLCQAITGRSDSANLLQLLQVDTPIFLGGIDSDWFRIHSLAREFLKDRFDALPNEERREAYVRAARWLAEHRMFEAAARQALNAGEDQVAYEFMAHCLYDMVIAGHAARITEWVERLPTTEIEKSPNLRLAVAWTLAMSKRHDEAARLVTPLLDDPTTDPSKRCESAEICASAAMFADDFDAMERIISPWDRSLPAQPLMLRVVGINQLAVVALYRGAPEKARYYYQEMASADLSSIGEYTRGMMNWVAGISYLWQGQVRMAEQLLRRSLTHAEEECGRRSPVSVMLASALAMALWERDLTGELPPLLANRIDVLERRGSPDAIVMGYVYAARSAAKAGLEGRAFDLLEGLYALGEAHGLPRLSALSLVEQIRMHALRSHGDACATLVGRLDRFATPKTYKRWGLLGPLLRLQIGIAHAYKAVALKDWKQVLAELDVSKQIAEQLRRSRDSIQISLLQALAHKRCGEDSRVLFGEAVSMAETLGLERILVDTHPDLIDWMRQLRGVTATTRWSEPTGVESESPALRPVVRTSAFPSVLLTPKEGEVLQLLAGKLSNKEIALAMDVSDETVKWHLKNLFNKLDAGSRKHLLARGRLLGLLDNVA